MSYGRTRYWVGRAMRVGAMVLLANSQLAQAADDTPLLTEARQLLDAGQAARAVALLQPQMSRLAGQAGYDYLLGLALYISGQTGQAMFAFERVLMVAPGHVDARLKAAQISAERGDADSVNELLAPLATQRLDSNQQQLLDEINETLAATSRPLTLRAYIQTGFGNDDNVTGGPDQQELLIPQPMQPPTQLQLPIPLPSQTQTLPPPQTQASTQPPTQTKPPPPPPTQTSTLTQLGDASRERDTVGMLEAGISLVQQVGDDTWLNGDASLHQGFNRVRKDVTAGYGNLSAGVVTRSGSEYLAAALMGQNYQVSDKTYRNTLGWRANWTHAFADKSSLSAYVQQLSFKYPDYPIDDSTRSIVGVMRVSAFGEAIALQYGIYGGKEIARDASKPHFSFKIAGVDLGASMMVGPNLSLSAAASYESRPHEAVDAIYHYTRQDTVRSVSLSADYRLSRDWHLVPRYTYLRNASNIELYDYTRNTFMLQLRWEYGDANN